MDSQLRYIVQSVESGFAMRTRRMNLGIRVRHHLLSVERGWFAQGSTEIANRGLTHKNGEWGTPAVRSVFIEIPFSGKRFMGRADLIIGWV